MLVPLRVRHRGQLAHHADRRVVHRLTKVDATAELLRLRRTGQLCRLHPVVAEDAKAATTAALQPPTAERGGDDQIVMGAAGGVPRLVARWRPFGTEILQFAPEYRPVRQSAMHAQKARLR